MNQGIRMPDINVVSMWGVVTFSGRSALLRADCTGGRRRRTCATRVVAGAGGDGQSVTRRGRAAAQVARKRRVDVVTRTTACLPRWRRCRARL
jgi:hypothetical protein